MGKFTNVQTGFALLVATSFSMYADDTVAIRQKLVSEYALTQPTADKTDIVTAGAVLVLRKGDVMMATASGVDVCQNSYKDGRVTQNGVCRTKKLWDFAKQVPGFSGPDSPTMRTFVPGEKLWVTAITVGNDGVVFQLFTDAIADVRYKAALKFPFPKGQTPSTNEVQRTVAEVFKVQPRDDENDAAQVQGAGGQQQALQTRGLNAQSGQMQAALPARNLQQPSEAAPPPLAVPPPPPADPKTISLGQTPDQVTAILGQPEKKFMLGAKQVFVYKDMKVIFVDGKVKDVQ